MSALNMKRGPNSHSVYNLRHSDSQTGIAPTRVEMV
jgi:hypothetical protein